MQYYTNPVYPHYFADPFVWKHEGRYHAVGTGPIWPEGSQSEGMPMAFPLLVSANLVEWQLHGGALQVPSFARGGGDFWAPEVAYHEGRFYLYYSVATEGLKHQLRVASSELPTGPYIDQGQLLPPEDECPFAIDAHPFRDDNGKFYLFYARDFLDRENGARVGTALVGDEMIWMTRLAGKKKTILRATRDWQLFQAKRQMYDQIYDWHTLEGPCVRKHAGLYYCFYSGGCYQGENYGVDYAVSEFPLGPYADTGGDHGPRVLKTAPGKVIGPGHHCIVLGPDDQTEYIVYHAWDAGMQARRMCIDPLVWTAEGPRCLGPSWEKQPLK